MRIHLTTTFRYALHTLFVGVALSCIALAVDTNEVKLPVAVRFVRAYGASSETLPPVVNISQKPGTIAPVFGERFVTIEIDIQADVPPAMYATVVHCAADWKEDGNVFLNDIATMRTSSIMWRASGIVSPYYSYRGTLVLPNETIKIPYGGNWVVKFFDYDRSEDPIAEARFFAVDPKADCNLEAVGDFYQPLRRTSPAALSIEATVVGASALSDPQMHTAVFYRLNRWNEPFVASQFNLLSGNRRSRFSQSGGVAGASGIAKRFRITQIPAENDYRILDLTNTAQFPRSNSPVRLALADLRRNGAFGFRADDGAMLSQNLSLSFDDYVPVEFVLDPENRPSLEDVFVLGSFNNWNATAEWQMWYDEGDRLYRLRHWIRRARHNYMYATGRINADSRGIDGLSFEEFEGNNVSAGHTFIAFIYFRELSFGGYDSIVAVGAASIFGSYRR